MTKQANRTRAKRLLTHYLRMVAMAAGVLWSDDSETEIGDLVDCLIDAAREEAAPDEEREQMPAYIGRCRNCHAAIGATVDDGTHQQAVADFLYEMASNAIIVERTTVGEARKLLGSCTCPPEPDHYPTLDAALDAEELKAEADHQNAAHRSLWRK